MNDSKPQEALVQHVAQLVVSGEPLAEGLRALADELPERVQAESLRSMAASLEAGQSLDECLARDQNLKGWKITLNALSRLEGRVELLAQLLAHQQRIATERKKLAATLIYPACVAVVGLAVVFLVPWLFANTFEQILQLGLRTGRSPTWMIAIGQRVSPAVLGMMTVAGVVCLVARFLMGRDWWSWLLSETPIVGRIWSWSGVAEYLRWLSLLIDARLPLPEALRVAATQVDNVRLKNTAQNLARCIEGGESFSGSVHRTRAWSFSTLPLLLWGERTGSLQEALLASAEMLEGRARSRADWIRHSVPPLVFTGVGVMVLSMAAAVLDPIARFFSEFINLI